MFRLLLPCLVCYVSVTAQQNKTFITYSHGAIVRGDSTKKELALVFTADQFGEGLPVIITTLEKHKIKGSFFFTGRFFRNKTFQKNIKHLNNKGHYLGPHSDQHLLYCDWIKRDSLLVTKDSFSKDINQNLEAIKDFGLHGPHSYFIPPFEWWNDSIAVWNKQLNLFLFNFTPGIRTAVDYTWPELPSYKNNDWIMNQLKQVAETKPTALNGSIILIHAGTDPRRKDKFYNRLEELIIYLKQKGYAFKRIDELLKN